MSIDAPEASSFALWLQAAAAEAGANDVVELTEVLVANGCYCRGATVASWLEGSTQPSIEKTRVILGALNKAIDGFDVWEQYGRWKEGQPFFQHHAAGGREPPPDLLRTIEAGGLPPPLEG